MKIEAVISVLALLVSLGTFGYERVKDSREASADADRIVYNCFRAGRDATVLGFFDHQGQEQGGRVNGFQNRVSATLASSLSVLEVDVDFKSLNMCRPCDQSPFFAEVHEAFREAMLSRHGSECVKSYNAGKSFAQIDGVLRSVEASDFGGPSQYFVQHYDQTYLPPLNEFTEHQGLPLLPPWNNGGRQRAIELRSVFRDYSDALQTHLIP